MPALPDQKVAFVTGANGISGYAIIEHLVQQPKEEWYVSFLFDSDSKDIRTQMVTRTGARLLLLQDALSLTPGLILAFSL